MTFVWIYLLFTSIKTSYDTSIKNFVFSNKREVSSVMIMVIMVMVMMVKFQVMDVAKTSKT